MGRDHEGRRVLAVDAGNSKTDVALVAHGRQVLATATRTRIQAPGDGRGPG